MNRKDYQKLRDEAKREYDEKIKALDTVWEMVHGRPPANSGGNNGNPASPAREWTHNISKRDAVREAMKTIPGEFNIHRVRDALKAVHPTVEPEIADNQLSAIVSKLFELDELKQIRQKVGKAPAVYTNVTSHLASSKVG
jgi:hypothetical protein